MSDPKLIFSLALCLCFCFATNTHTEGVFITLPNILGYVMLVKRGTRVTTMSSCYYRAPCSSKKGCYRLRKSKVFSMPGNIVIGALKRPMTAKSTTTISPNHGLPAEWDHKTDVHIHTPLVWLGLAPLRKLLMMKMTFGRASLIELNVGRPLLEHKATKEEERDLFKERSFF